MMIIFIPLKKFDGRVLWIGFNCLKARATSRRQFTLYQSPQKLLVLILPNSEEWKAESTPDLSSGFEQGPLDWESSTLKKRPLKLQKKLPKLLENLSIYLSIYLSHSLSLCIYIYVCIYIYMVNNTTTNF